MTTVSIKGLKKYFSDSVAVDSVDLSIGEGELFFLLGPSGCGKTTLLRMVAGFTTPDKGTIHFGNKNITSLAPEKRNTAMVFQGYALWPHMSVFDNVAFGLSVRKVDSKTKQQRVNQALETANIQALAKRKPNQLSGGQQQRVALARALVIEPSVLLLDEPLSNLDTKLRNQMRGEIKRICKKANITAIYVTHDQKEALSIADKIAVMQNGKIVQTDAPKNLYTRPTNKFVADFLGQTNFIPAKIIARFGARVKLETSFGQLISTVFPDNLPMSGNVTCSIRPEAIKLQHLDNDTDTNKLTGTCKNATYMGEIAEYEIAINDTQNLQAYELNPLWDGKNNNLQKISIDYKDVVILSD